MKNSILIICLLIATVFSSNVMAQITSSGTLVGLNLPKRECEVLYNWGGVNITGNNSKTIL